MGRRSANSHQYPRTHHHSTGLQTNFPKMHATFICAINECLLYTGVECKVVRLFKDFQLSFKPNCISRNVIFEEKLYWIAC